ncbi:MAG: polysaccharide biosynthesis protein [Clostridiales Family XIII bacterium]|nr:polysaccharide biosynthesis protein [Clostridiales Family XIII bacterium]
MGKYIRIAVLIAVDMIAVNISFIFSYLMRSEFNPESELFVNWFSAYADNIPAITLIKIAVFFAFGLYRSLWRYAGAEEIMKITVAMGVATLAVMGYMSFMLNSVPRSIYVMSFIVDVFVVGGSRVVYRILIGIKGQGGISLNSFDFRLGALKLAGSRAGEISRVMIVGAGDAGASMIKEIKHHPEHNKRVIVAIDDDPSKRGKRIIGVRIAGGRKEIRSVARRYGVHEIIIAIPSASKRDIQAIVSECNSTRCRLKILPGLIDLINDKVSVSKLRDVDIEDLLGREPVEVNLREISGYIEGRIVMVTGGGGSIGSELCRQIAGFRPRRLVAVDIYENSIFDLANEMKAAHPGVEFEVTIASVRDKARMREVFSKYMPHVIFHAAAHKHVPLMEMNPKEAVANNILGTANMIDLADEFAAEKFVMISTDKAVNPTNVMGASKRVAEMILQEKCKVSKNTHFAVVRFGNVLGSNGSVIPFFRKQIEDGGPVTVTHEEITRYFMTIPEAVQLVIQAGALAEGGEMFILDMGEPVKIKDLAENVIRLSGYTPYEDIDIVFTKLRPGEKLHEELILEAEGAKPTRHEKIFVGRPLPPSEMLCGIMSGDRTLEDIVYNDIAALSDGQVKEWLHKLAPNYTIMQEKPRIRGVVIDDDE